MYKRAIAVVGVGNILMADEGFGVRVVEQLEFRNLSENITLIDAGNWFFDIAPSLSVFEKVIIVDVTKGGEKPGTIYRFRESDIQSQSATALSLHDFGVIESLNLERLVRKMPADIVFFGIEPQKIELSFDLSTEIQRKVSVVIDRILKEIGTE